MKKPVDPIAEALERRAARGEIEKIPYATFRAQENENQQIRDDLNRLQNGLYDLIFPVLAKYETRGHNAHQRMQNIIRTVTEESQVFIAQSLGRTFTLSDLQPDLQPKKVYIEYLRPFKVDVEGDEPPIKDIWANGAKPKKTRAERGLTYVYDSVPAVGGGPSQLMNERVWDGIE